MTTTAKPHPGRGRILAELWRPQWVELELGDVKHEERAKVMVTKKQNDKAEALGRPTCLDIPADVEIVTREIAQLADVILEIARHETVPAVST